MSNTFKALRAELESEELTIKITELGLENLPDGDTTIDVHYSSLNYKDGMAVAAVSGTLNGVLDNRSDCTLGSIAEFLEGLDSRTMMVDYTEYAERFYNEAELICDGCNWGYINIYGNWSIPSIYDFAKSSISLSVSAYNFPAFSVFRLLISYNVLGRDLDFLVFFVLLFAFFFF